MEIHLSYYPISHGSPIKSGGLVLLDKGGHNTQKFAYVGSDGYLKCYRFDKNQLNLRFGSTDATGNQECLTTDGDTLIASKKNNIAFYNRKGIVQKTTKTPFDGNITAMMSKGSSLYIASGTFCGILGNPKATVSLSAPVLGFASNGDVIYVGITSGNVYSFVPGSTQLVLSLQCSLTLMTTFQISKKDNVLVIGGSDKVLRFYNTLDKQISQIDLPSPPTAITSYDIDKNGSPELFVTMENGSVALISTTILETPKIINTISIGFSASNIAAGYIYSDKLISAIVTSPSGQIGLLSAEPRTDRSLLNSHAPKVTETELNNLRKEINDLEGKTKSGSKLPIVPVQTKIELRSDQAAQHLVLICTCERPISKICFSATIPVKATQRSDCQTEITMARRKEPISSGVVKPNDASAARVSFDIAYETGVGGELSVFVCYANSASVFSQDFHLKPFGLMTLLGSDPLSGVKDDSLSYVEIASSGASSVFHEIVSNCLPVELDDGVPLSFTAGAVGECVTCIVSGEKFIARSVFFPLIVQLKTYIVGALNNARQKFVLDTHLGPNCLSKLFSEIGPRLIEVNRVHADYARLTALQEVRNATQAGFRDDESWRVIADSAEIQRRWSECSSDHAAIYSLLEQFYIEMWRKEYLNPSSGLSDFHLALKDVHDEETLKALELFMQVPPK